MSIKIVNNKLLFVLTNNIIKVKRCNIYCQTFRGKNSEKKTKNWRFAHRE